MGFPTDQKKRSQQRALGRQKMPILTVTGPVFYSQLDERLFFDGLHSIGGIQAVTGESTNIKIRTRRPLSVKAKRELDALLKRFNTSLQIQK